MIKDNNYISSQYNIYFGGGNKSIYNRRFGHHKVIARERSIINQTFKEVFNKLANDTKITNKEFRILDFGCGDGRLFEVIERNAIKLTKKTHFKFKYLAYDISQVALDNFRINLKDHGYTPVDDQADGSLTNGIIRVEFILAESTNEDQHLIKVVNRQSIHLNLCMFGTISHIRTKDTRQKILTAFGKVADPIGKIIISVPRTKTFSKELFAFQTMREHYQLAKKYKLSEYQAILEPLLELLPENGDLFYLKENQSQALLNYCHIINVEQFDAQLKHANLTAKQSRVLSIISLPNLTKKSLIIRILDQSLSYLLSFKIISDLLSQKLADQLIWITKISKSSNS